MSQHSARGAEWRRLRETQLVNYNYECAGLFPEVCTGDGGGYPLELDHIVPISRGGENTIENTRILCKACNSKKSDRDDVQQKSWWSPKFFPAGAVRKPGY